MSDERLIVELRVEIVRLRLRWPTQWIGVGPANRHHQVVAGCEAASSGRTQSGTWHYDERELATLVVAVALTNVWNRLNVATRQVAGTWG